MKAPGWPVVLTSSSPRSGTVTLRPVRASHAHDWEAARRRSRDWLIPWDATPPPASASRPRSFRALTRRLRAAARKGQTLPFVIEVDGVFAGQITVSNIVRGSAQFATVGYWIDQRFAGKGVVPRAAAMVIDHCFGPVGLHRIEIAIRPENSNSLRVVEKLGLREYGYAPRFLHINGAWCDHRLYAVTVEECPGGMLARLDAAPD